MAENSSQPISVITGGAGFLGSHLTDRLLAEGHRVIAIDSLITGNVANIEHLAGNKSYKFICHDVTDFIYIPGRSILFGILRVRPVRSTTCAYRFQL